MPAARISQRDPAGEMPHSTTGEFDFGIFPAVVNGVEEQGFVVMNIHPAEHVDDVDEGIKIHLHVVIHRHADEVRDRLHRQTRAAAGKLRAASKSPGCVDPAVAKARDIDPHIARDGKHPGCVRGRIDR